MNAPERARGRSSAHPRSNSRRRIRNRPHFRDLRVDKAIAWNAIYCMPVPRTSLPPRPLLRDEVLRAPPRRDRRRHTRPERATARHRTGHVARREPNAGPRGAPRTGPERARPLASRPLDGRRPARRDECARRARPWWRPMHRLAVEGAVPRLTTDDLDRMRDANDRFDAAQRSGDADAALAPIRSSTRSRSTCAATQRSAP